MTAPDWCKIFIIDMKKVIVDSWTKIPFIGVQISNFNDPEKAFIYAELYYVPYGYNLAYFSTDTNTLYLSNQ